MIVKKNIVCDGPMRKKYKSTMLLMGGTDSPNAFALGSLFKLIFSYNKKEDAEGGIATRKVSGLQLDSELFSNMHGCFIL